MPKPQFLACPSLTFFHYSFHPTIGIVPRTNGRNSQRLLADAAQPARQPHLYHYFNLSQLMAAFSGAERNNDSTVQLHKSGPANARHRLKLQPFLKAVRQVDAVRSSRFFT